MSASDWLVPMDDAFCARLRTCTICGARPGPHGWFDIWTGADIAVAVLLCARCRAAEPKHHTLSALLERRYGMGGKVEMIAPSDRSQDQAAGSDETDSSRAAV